MRQMFCSAKAVIFDLDGTLYDRQKLCKRMLFEMFRRCTSKPSSIRDVMIVSNFRKAREAHSTTMTPGLDRLQFEWGGQRSGAPVERVQRVVKEWMFDRPLKHLPACRFDGVRELFSLLREIGIRIGVFSDYPARDKMDALGLRADVLVSATDPDVDRLKPDPKGLLLAASRLGVPMGGCLFIGDREDKDGECARRAGMQYLIMKTQGRRNGNEFGSFLEILECFRDQSF
jgi:phosphoglycolate phosphatase/putative hydrolase of the HAD superfamily